MGNSAAGAAATPLKESDFGLSICLVGKTGGGKSSLGNALLGLEEAFKTNFSATSETFECAVETKQAHGRKITIVDTPGTLDTTNVTDALDELRKAIQKCPFGFHAFLIVLPVGRFTDEDFGAIQALTTIFGEEIAEYSIFVFTNADKCDNDLDKFKQELEKSREKVKGLDALLKRCSDRLAIIDNSHNCKKNVQKKQIDLVFKAVKDLHEAKGKKYTNELFKEVQEQIEAKRKEEEENARQKKEEEERSKKKMEEELKKVTDELQRQLLEQKMASEFEKQMHEMQRKHDEKIRERDRQDNERMVQHMKEMMEMNEKYRKGMEDRDKWFWQRW